MRTHYPVMPCVQIITIARVAFDSNVALTVTSVIKNLRAGNFIRPAYPLSAFMKTNATSFPVAALAAPVRSVSLSDVVTVVPSALARAVMASEGYVHSLVS